MAARADHEWRFITSHAAVLLGVHRNPRATVRELAKETDLTERQVHRVLADLVEAEYVRRRRVGRRNEYAVNGERPMRHRSVEHLRIRELLATLAPRGGGPQTE